MHDKEWLLRLKAHCLSVGIKVAPEVTDILSHGGQVPLTVHEYATTGGITLHVGDVYINAPFDEWYCERSTAELSLTSDLQFEVCFDGSVVPCEVLPLPGYLDAVNRLGNPVTDTTMSHCDRIRVSPLMGCALDCHFCDIAEMRYTRRDADEVLASVAVARADSNLPASHVLISGGSPGPAHFGWFDDTLTAIIEGSGLPTDIMMSPREGPLSHIARFTEAGATGFSLNLEVFGDAAGGRVMPLKHRRSSPHTGRTIEAAVDAVGSNGNVRSLVIVGLDDWDSTITGIEFLASLGCEPVLSPFRPARDTKMHMASPPAEQFLLDVHAAAIEIAATHGLRLGPRCIPCQHNTLVIPDGSDDYYYSADR